MVRAMADQRATFFLRATAAGIAKGLLAVPRKHRAVFPTETTRITIVFDDEDEAHVRTFRPYDPKGKESRIYGLGRWYADRGVRPFEPIRVELENPRIWRYRISLPRYLKSKAIRVARERLYDAETDQEALAHLKKIADVDHKRTRTVALAELTRLSEARIEQRKRRAPSATPARETVPAPLRVLLATAHRGRCQVCGFGFVKRDGTPYFELHHDDPESGHHPHNILLLCANCHAQFEWANIGDVEFLAGWPVAVKINGKRYSIRQPLLPKDASARRSALQLVAIQLVWLSAQG